MITVVVDGDSPIPPFEQLRGQLADAIRAGAMAAGTKLPTVRQLAADLGIAPNTVAKAYRSLEDDGLVEADGRRGTRVASDLVALSPADRGRLLTAAAERYLAEARRLGASPTEAIDHVTSAAGTAG